MVDRPLRRQPCSATRIATLALLSTLGLAASAAAQPLLEWWPASVERTVGNGTSSDLTVSFTSRVDLTGVDLYVARGLEPYVEVSPRHLGRVVAGRPYDVRIHFKVPPGATEGSHTGLIQARVGRRVLGTRRPGEALQTTVHVDFGSIQVSSAARVLSSATLDALETVVDGVLSFRSDTAELATLAPGHVLAMPPSAALPSGLMRRIERVERTAGRVVLTTVPAAIEEAIESGTVSLSRSLSPSDIRSAVALRPGVSFALAEDTGTGRAADTPTGFFVSLHDVVLLDGGPDEGDEILANGSISVDPRLDVQLSWAGFLQPSLMRVAFTVTERVELDIGVEATLSEGEKRREVARFRLQPIVVYAGVVPITFEPSFVVDVGVKGDLTAGISFGAYQESTVTVGAVWTPSGGWAKVESQASSFRAEPPSLSLEASGRVFGGPRFQVIVEGVVGPYAEVDGFVEAEVTPLESPRWKVYAGYERSFGVRAEVFSYTLGTYEFPLTDGYRRLLLQEGPLAEGVVGGVVRDAATRSALPGVAVTALHSGAPVLSAATGPSGEYALTLPAGPGYELQFTRGGYQPAIYDGVEVFAQSSTYLEAVLQVDTAHQGPGAAGGTIVDALSGAGLSGVLVRLRPGINARTGSPVAITQTAANGSFVFSGLAGGQYTAEATREGYSSAWFTIVVVGGATTSGQGTTMTPTLPSGETRLVLTWGASPGDLDSHLTGPLPNGTRFHLYYPYRGTSPWPEYVSLDRDDTTSYGPETTTILQQISGLYRFSVHDFTNAYSTTSTALSNSAAQVRVYRGSGLLAVFTVPPNRGGTLWTVFEMSGDMITPVNTMSYVSSSGSVPLRRGRADDTPLLRRLPAKRGR
jgi:hypothetical protein